VLVALRVLPLGGRLPGEERLQGAGDRAHAEAGRPRLLAVHPHVELRHVALLARLRLRRAGHRAHHRSTCSATSLRRGGLGALHLDVDRLAAPAEDRGGAGDVGLHARDLRSCPRTAVWTSACDRSRSDLGLSLTKIEPLLGVPRKPPPTLR
jgi:hypothetical protein